MKTTMQMTGLRELGQAMGELSQRVQRNIAASATSAGARVIAKEAKARAKKRSGTMAKAIRTTNLKPTTPGIRETSVDVRTEGKQSGSKPAAFYWHMVEFGTAKMPAQPFMRPAFEAKKEEAANKIKDQLKKRLDAEAAKIGTTIGKAK